MHSYYARRLSFFLIFLVLFSAGIHGEYFYSGSEAITTLDHICRRMGKALPFSSFPVHGSDILAAARKLAADPAFSRLGETDAENLENLIVRFENQDEDDIYLTGNLALAYEKRFTSNSFTIDNPSETTNGEDFRRAYLDFSPVYTMGAGAGTFTGPWIDGQIDIRPHWAENYDTDSNFFSKVDIAFDVLKRGLVAWNGTYLNASIGRDTVHWGDPNGSTLYPSNLLPYLDSIRLNLALGPFSFDYLLGSILPKRSQYHDVDLTPNPAYGFTTDDNPSTILVAAHRFQWNFGSLKAGIGGTVVYARRNNMFLITDILPVTTYHNTDVAPNNLTLCLDLSWAFYPGFSLSAMLGFDDINARIFGIPDGDVPTIPAGILTLEHSAARDAFFVRTIAEAGYTHYLWGNYNYDDPPDAAGAPLARSIFRYAPNHYSVLLPLTSPYGPGVIWGKLKTEFEFFIGTARLTAGAELLVLTKNRDVNLVDTIYSIDDTTQDSPRIWYTSLSIPLCYTRNNFDFSVTPALRFGTSDFALECTLGVRFSLEGNTFIKGPY